MLDPQYLRVFNLSAIGKSSVTVQKYETYLSRNDSFCCIHLGNLRVSELPTNWCRHVSTSNNCVACLTKLLSHCAVEI